MGSMTQFEHVKRIQDTINETASQREQLLSQVGQPTSLTTS